MTCTVWYTESRAPDSDHRPFECSKCGKTFKRKDIFTRHAGLCQVVAEPEIEKPAIDLPSLSNDRRKSPCVLEADSLSYLWNMGTTESLLTAQLEIETFERLQIRGVRSSLSFFIRVTAKCGLAATFDPEFQLEVDSKVSDGCALEDPRTIVGPPVSHLPNFILDMPEDFACKEWMDSISSNLIYTTALDIDTGLTSELTLPSPMPCLTPGGRTTIHATESDPLLEITGQIVADIQLTIRHKAPNSSIRLNPGSASTAATEFFSAFNLRRFVDIYWSTWYTHWPVFHKPTFDIFKVPHTLLAAMALIGASYSANTTHRDHAKMFGDVVEEMIFGDEFFGDSSPCSVLNAACADRRLRALQAAHAICLYQFWEGDERARRRVRKHRFGQVVAMARELGYARAVHADLVDVAEDDFDWQDFGRKEEYIRTLNYIVVLDSGFVMMNSIPPRVLPWELAGDLICPEACFQAATKADCFAFLKTWFSSSLRRGRRLSMAQAFKMLGSHEMDAETVRYFSHLGHLNLGILIMGIHSVFFTVRSFGAQYAGKSVRHWLRNWNRIWMLHTHNGIHQSYKSLQEPNWDSSGSDNRWRSPGFLKDSLQFWYLAQLVHRRLIHEQSTPRQSMFGLPSGYASVCDQADMADLKSLLRMPNSSRQEGGK